MELIDVMGFAGAAIVLVAFALTTAGSARVTPRKLAVMNLGAGMLAVNGLVHQAWPSTVLNTVWFAVAVLALARRSASRSTEPSDQTRSGAADADRNDPVPLSRSSRRVIRPNTTPVTR